MIKKDGGRGEQVADAVSATDVVVIAHDRASTRILVNAGDLAKIDEGLRLLGAYASHYAESKGMQIRSREAFIARLCHLGEEWGELAEACREGLDDSSDKLPGFTHAEEEAAEMLLLLTLLAHATGWRLGHAVAAIIEQFSATRPGLDGKAW